MKVLNITILSSFKKKHPTSRRPLSMFLKYMQSHIFKNFSDIKKVYGKRVDKLPTKYGRDLYCFDIKANDFRLVAVVTFQLNELYVKEVMTHKEYEKKYCKGK